MRLNIITGGPGIGKTTLLEALAEKGYNYIPEAARYLIGKGVRPGDKGFKEEVIKTQLAWEQEYDAVFSDRGLIDSVGYCNYYGDKLPENFPEGVENRYSRIFILDRLPNYVNDSARKECDSEAKAIHEHVIEAYRSFGYDPIFIPAVSVEERADLVLEELRTERERKFLLYENGKWYCDPLTFKDETLIKQGYLDAEGSEFDQVRVRQHGDRFFLTKKSGNGHIRKELEEEISRKEFEELWPGTFGKRVFKKRFSFKGFEVDRYLDRDLVIAEAEGRIWSIGKEVTEDEKYSNFSLAK